MTKYEGRWDRNMKYGSGTAVFNDGNFYRGRFKIYLIDGMNEKGAHKRLAIYSPQQINK